MNEDKIKKEFYELTDRQKKYSHIKDFIDRSAGVMGTILAAPVFLAICLMIKKEEGLKAPVFFKQKRVGKNQQLFELYKFRTMRLDTPHDMPTHLLSNPEQYITVCGRFLRRYSLDELPQFINIIKGDMAISGPRPALWNQADLIAEREAYGVHQIKPGLTGWAQIHGRDELEIEEKAKLDAYYLHHFGLWIDIKCFFGTVLSVLKSDGVVEGGTGEIHKKEAEKISENKDEPKRVILVANVAKEHILKFHVPTIKMLKDKGWYVDVACSGDEEIPYCDTHFYMCYKRNPFSLDTAKGIIQFRRILKNGHYDIMSCHTPTGGVVARIAALGLKRKPYVIYTAHGFHFFKGAPLMNWLVYFPIEWILSHCTDELVVINKEDYANAVRYRMGMKKITLIPGMGVDKKRFSLRLSDEEKKILRREIGIPVNEFVYTYVAEVLRNKNQTMLLHALKMVRDKTGKGVLLLVGPIHDDGECQKLAEELGIADYVFFTGWRSDVERIFNITDVCVASSIREGLGLNLIEAQFSGVPVIASENRGHKDVIENKKNGFLINCYDSREFAKTMILLQKNAKIRQTITLAAMSSAELYSRENSLKSIWRIYRDAK